MSCCWNGLFPHSLESFHLHPFSVDEIGGKCSSFPLMRWLCVRTRNWCWKGFVLHSFKAVHCNPSSVVNIARKCTSSPLIRWLWIRTRNCCWKGFFPHFHPSSVYNILIPLRLSIAIRLLLIIKGVSAGLARWWDCFESGQGIVVGMDLSLIRLTLAFAIRFLLII